MDREQTIAVWDGGVRMRVLSAGAGPALVFLHGPWGLAWDSFLDDLARSFTVYAPEHPGTTPEAHDDIYRLDGLWDLILCHDELLTALKIEEALVVGHSFGGMVACELAAYPRRVRRLALIDPIGLWRDTDPIVNWVKLSPTELPNYIFRDPAVEAAQQMFGTSRGGPPITQRTIGSRSRQCARDRKFADSPLEGGVRCGTRLGILRVYKKGPNV